MQAEIITIGTEILLGNIQNTNSRYLAEKLAKCGIDLYHITTVGDNKNRITTLLRQSLQRSDLVITTGGLGPTKDDLTREAIAETLNIPLQLNEELLKELKQFFSARNYNMTKNNIKQARIPKDAKIIRNSEGTAPGFICRCKQGEKNIISLPGVPREMKNMFTSLVIPYLKKIQDSVIKSRVLHFIGIGESTLETRLKDKMLAQSNPSLALLADKGEVKIRITAKAISDEKAEAMIK
ncbi:MAG: competence/damage-inducible protein A, partial [Halanaerobiales bacterium]